MELSFFDLEAIEKLGEYENDCPLCRMKEESLRKTVYTILYELVNDSGVRARFNEEGLCNEHAKFMVKIAKEYPELGGLGPAIIFKDILEESVEDIKKLTFKRVKEQNFSYYLCRIEREYEEVYTRAFAKIFRSIEEGKEYENQKSVFCLRHTSMVFRELSKHKAVFNWFKRIQIEKYEEIVAKLEIFIKKYDYRRKNMPFGDEVSAWKLSAKILGK